MGMLKRGVGRLGCECLYWVGHIISIPLNEFDIPGVFYVCSWFILTSARMQDWGGCKGPWLNIKESVRNEHQE